MSSPIQYNFNNEQDLGFYILNAVCHDWIHDFNNYERMSKILNYIMGLVPSSELVEVSTALSNAESEDIVSDYNMYSKDDTPSEPTITFEDRNISDTNPVETNTSVFQSATLEPDVLSVQELYASQVDQYLENTPIVPKETEAASESLPAHQTIVNKSIQAFNEIKINTQAYQMTRGNVRKINILQKLSDFIGEAQLLVISKISNFIGSFTQTNEGFQNMFGGASAINIIKTQDISSSIHNIIKEIDETSNISEDSKKNLKNVFRLINEVFVNLNIQGISPLEIFNNSVITEITSMFIVNKCENMDIHKEAILYLKTILQPLPVKTTLSPYLTKPSPLAKGIYPTKNYFPNTFDRPNLFTSPMNFNAISVAAGGSPFSAKVYSDNTSLWNQLDAKIDIMKGDTSNLYKIYTGTTTIVSDNGFNNIVYGEYTQFIEGMKEIITLIVGPQMYNVKTKQVTNLYEVTKRGGRNLIKNIQQMVDTMNDFIFDKTIETYEDIKNKSKARLEDSGETGRITGEARGAVQHISKLVAKKTLELTDYLTADGKLNTINFNGNQDLTAQANIIMQTVNPGKGYTTVDNLLIEYFNKMYAGKEMDRNGSQFISGVQANNNLINQMSSCNGINSCRVINNAIPNGDVKESIKKIVVCPTSSVCDGMGAFGSCINPTSTQKEYFNMDFNVSYSGGNTNFYQGSTILKNGGGAVNLNYGFHFKNLQLYNFLDINITTQPIILQANYTFKGVINRIIEIWKSASGVTDIDQLWELLEFNDYFLSVLKLGSQKAVGDIFQEINSTLENGGYSVPTRVNEKKTFGLMGDRPSGVRVLKLLKDSSSGINPNACGGYIGGETSLVYFPSSFISTIPVSSKRVKIGGKNSKKKIKHKKKTYKQKKYINKSIKKRKYNNKKTKKYL
jgi:hypothetical protein